MNHESDSASSQSQDGLLGQKLKLDPRGRDFSRQVGSRLDAADSPSDEDRSGPLNSAQNSEREASKGPRGHDLSKYQDSYAEPLFAFSRGDHLEVIVHGRALFRDSERPVSDEEKSSGQTRVIARSLINPWYYLVADLETDHDFFALALGSHAGQPPHLVKLTQFLEFAGINEEDLFCPRTRPYDPQHWGEYIAEIQPTRLFHPSSGKHLMMVTGCRAQLLDAKSYCDPQHPLIKKLYSLLGKEAGEKLVWHKDSCGLPTPSITMDTLISLWQKLVLSTDSKISRMLKIWCANPKLAGGVGRLDTELMGVMAGAIVAKEGEDGMLMIQTLPRESDRGVQSCFVKLAGGHNGRHLSLALWSVLKNQKELNSVMATLKDYLDSRLEAWIPKDQELVVGADL